MHGSLDVPFAYASNGDGFVEHDRTWVGDAVERTLKLHEFPSPDELWARHCKARNGRMRSIEVEAVVAEMIAR